MHSSKADEFWTAFEVHLEAIREEVQDQSSNNQAASIPGNPGGSTDGNSHGEGTAQATLLLHDAKRLIHTAGEDDHNGVKQICSRLVANGLSYLPSITAARSSEVTGRREAPAPQDLESAVDQLRELVDKKGEDYESGRISFLCYCLLGPWSILHEIHKRALRFFSLQGGRTANFEDVRSTLFDLCAFGLFLLAYLEVEPDLDGGPQVRWELVTAGEPPGDGLAP